MTVYIVNKWSGRWEPGIESFHYGMFHGLARREGGYTGPCDDYFLDENLNTRLTLIKNVFNIAPVFMPRSNFVVSDPLRNSLATFRGIVFLPTVFEKVFYVEWAQHDLSYPKLLRRNEDAARFMLRVRGAPVDPASLGKWYEVIPALREDPESDADATFFSEVPTGPYEGEDPVSFAVSKRQLGEHPLLYSFGGFNIVREDFFRVLSPHLDRRFFICRKAESTSEGKVGQGNDE